MASTSQDIQTHEGGPGYKHWATELTLEKILAILKGQGIDPKQIDGLLKSIDELNDNGQVDTKSLRNVLANLKQSTDKTKERDKTTDEKKKKEEGFWAKSNKVGKDAARAFKDANIKDHLKGAGDMFIMPVDSISDAFVKVAGLVGAFGAGLAGAATAVIDKLKIFGGKLGTVLKGAMGAAAWIAGGLTTVVGGLIGVIEQLGDSFFDMYDTGINFSRGLKEGESGLGAMAMAAADARLTVGEFAEFISENARVAVAIGADAMGSLSNSVRTALYPLGNLGLTAGETNEHLGEYLDLQRTLGVLDNLTRAQQARASTDYLTNLTLLSQITGKRRKQVAQDMKQAMQNTALTAWMLQLDEKDRAAAMKNTEAITGVLSAINPEAADAFAEGLGKGSMMLTDYGKTMAKAGYATEMAAQDELIRKVKTGEITAEQAQAEILRIQRSMKANTAAAGQLHALAVAGDAGAQAAVKHMTALQGAELDMSKLSTGMGKAEGAIGSWDEMQRAVSQTWTNFIGGLFKDKDFTAGLEKMASGLKDLLAPDGDFAKTIATFAKEAGPKLVAALGTLKDAMPDIIKWMKKLPATLKSLWAGLEGGIKRIRGIFFDESIDVDTGESTWVAKDMGKVMGDMWDKITAKLIEGAKNLPWGKIALAIAGIFAGKALLSAVTGGIARKLTGAVAGGGPKIGPKSPGSTMGGTLGKNIGGFVGGIGEGVMKGAAAGLAAFGKAGPAVVKGAVLLGLAIAAIATGIAGAQWILSKTMGPFADSLKGFTDLDGAALIKTGLGMSAIGVGLTAMGAGGVINAVGNLVGAGFEALGNLLGVKGPLERLREFGEAGKTIDAEGVKSTAEAMAAFSKAMALGGASTAITGIGTLVGGIASALGKLFGAKDPLTQLKTFGATKINSAGVKANAEAMSAFAKAMKDAPEVKGERTGGLFGFVAGLFAGSVKMPWDQVKLFAEAKLGDTANLKKNAEAMSAFGNAMSTMPEKVEGTRGGGLLGAIAYIFKGKITMPWDQVKLFAEADLGDTANLKKNAEAMSAFGTAMSSMPDKEIKGEKVGGIFGAVGFIFTGVTKMPWDRVKDFAGADLGDTANLKKNAEAMSAFGNAMSTMPEIKGEKVGGIFGAVGLIFTGVTKMPWDRVKDFSVADLGETTSLVANADKLKLFGVAMKDMPEIVPSSTAGGIFGWLAKAFVGDVTYPWTQVKTFANADLGEAASLVANADKLKLFGDAMEDMPAIVPSTTAGGVFGWLAKAFVGDVTYPWDQVSAFANANLGEATSLIANAGKLKLFGVAMEDMPAIVPSTTTGGVFGWLAKAFVGDVTYPWTQVKAFADAVLGEAAKLTANADKLKLFGVAMESMPAIVPTTQTGGFFGWIASGFTAKTVYPWDQVKAFAEADMGDTTNLASNAIAMAAFSEAMTGIKPVEGTTGSGGWLGKISNFFTGAETMPWDQVKIFGGIEINAEGVIKNAKAMSAFAQSLGTVDGDKLKDNVNNIGDIKSGSWTGLTTALTGFQAIDSTALDAAGASLTKLTTPITALAEALPKDIKSRLLGFGSGLEELADYINDGELKTIGKLAEHLEKINLLGPIFDGGLTKDPNQLVKPATQPSRIGQSGWASTGSPGGTTTAAGTAATATADLVNAENSTIAVNADMLTSANNRETILGEIKVLLQELNTTTKDAKTKSEKSAVKLKNAVAATNPYMGI